MNEPITNAKDWAEFQALSLWLNQAQTIGLDALGGTWPEHIRKYRRFLTLSAQLKKTMRKTGQRNNLCHEEVA